MMKALLRVLPLLGVVGVLPVLARTAPPAPNPIEQTLQASSNAFVQALLHKDVPSLRRMLTTDFEEVSSAGHLDPAPELLEAVQNGEFHEYTPYNVHVLTVNAESAVVTYDCIISRPEGDGLAPRYQHVSQWWVQAGGVWKMKFLQSTPDRPE